MKRIALAVALVVAAAGLLAADDLAEYQPLMKQAAGACGSLGKALEAGDADAVKSNSADVAKHFGAISDWWDKKGVADAKGFAADAAQQAEAIHAMAGEGDLDGAKAQFGMLRANCKSCHAAHRAKAADGSWQIK